MLTVNTHATYVFSFQLFLDTVGEDIKAMIEDLNSGFSFATNINIVDDFHSRVQIPFGRVI